MEVWQRNCSLSEVELIHSRRHVLADLQPYICTFENCGAASHPFETRSEWWAHEIQVHRKEWCCNVDSHPPFATMEEFAQHMQSGHSGAFSGTQMTDIMAMCEHPLQSATVACPLCADDNNTPGDHEAVGSRLIKTPRLVSPNELRRHLAHHLEQLALFALPLSLRGGDNEGNNTNLSSEILCESCEGEYQENDPYLCTICYTIQCDVCWDRTPEHQESRTGALGVNHERMNAYVARRLEKIVKHSRFPGRENNSLQGTVDTTWFSKFYHRAGGRHTNAKQPSRV